MAGNFVDPRGAFGAPAAPAANFTPPPEPGTFVGPLQTGNPEDLKERERGNGGFSRRLPPLVMVAIAAVIVGLVVHLLKRGK